MGRAHPLERGGASYVGIRRPVALVGLSSAVPDGPSWRRRARRFGSGEARATLERLGHEGYCRVSSCSTTGASQDAGPTAMLTDADRLDGVLRRIGAAPSSWPISGTGRVHRTKGRTKPIPVEICTPSASAAHETGTMAGLLRSPSLDGGRAGMAHPPHGASLLDGRAPLRAACMTSACGAESAGCRWKPTATVPRPALAATDRWKPRPSALGSARARALGLRV